MEGNLNLISRHELERKAGRGDCMVIDLREPRLYRIGHSPGAVNLPFENYDRWSRMLPKTKRIILYCERGGSALQAGRQLARAGYRVEVVSGGYRPE